MNNPVSHLTSFDQVFNRPPEEDSERNDVYQYAVSALGLAAMAFAAYNARHFYWKCRQIKDQAAHAAKAVYRSYLTFTHRLIVNRSLIFWNVYLKQFEVNCIQTKQSETNVVNELRKRVDIVKPAATAIISQIFTDYCAKGQILELGSNLPKNGESHLATLLSQQDRKRVIHSDKSPASSRAICVDATRMEEQLEKSSREHIIALCVFDLIARRDLDKTVAGLHHTLQEKGNVIIISDLPFDPEALQQKFQDKFVFPYISEHSLGIKAVDISEVKKAARDIAFQPFMEFIDTLLSYSPTHRFHFLFLLCAKDPHFSKLLNEMCPSESYETAENSASFIADLESAFKRHGGFKILENGYRQTVVEVEGRLEDDANRRIVNNASFDLRRPSPLQFYWDFNIPNDTVRLTSTFYVFVAEKKS